MSHPHDKDGNWAYSKEIPEVSSSTREVLENYSKIAADQVVPHCYSIRDKAWDIHPYPCIGRFRFLDLSITQLPTYDEVVDRLKNSNHTFLDLGCCFGQDLRRLVYDGAPSENLYGADLRLDFMNLGYDLFLDKETLKSKFIAADVFDDKSDLKKLDGKVDIINSSAFFHLFDYERQKAVAHRIIKLLRPQKGSLLVGLHGGSNLAGARERARGVTFRHNLESWQQFWNEISEESNTKWEVQVGWGPSAKVNHFEHDWKWMVFAVRRTE